MTVSEVHPVVRWWLSGSNSAWDIPILLFFLIVGGGSGLQALEAWEQGQWPLFALLAFVAVAFLVAAGPQFLAELLVYLGAALFLAFAAVTLPALLFPKTRAWYRRLWAKADKAVSE
ncbi:hypothetical protein AB0C65_18735 [Nocardia sp. NPDC048505]|uniref:hypothetical protein n=1 Tax=Nocardia sp. NPDC048505 TaxID=3155756 RepID=UPI003410A659